MEELTVVEKQGEVTFLKDIKGKLFQKLQDHTDTFKVKDGKITYKHIQWLGGNEIKYNLNGVYGYSIFRKKVLMEDNIWVLREAQAIALTLKK